jgi:hypothetical protein
LRMTKPLLAFAKEKYMRNSVRYFLIIIPTILLLCSSAGSTTLSFNPSSVSVSPSGSVSIDIVLSDLLAGVASFDLIVNYDETVLGFDSYVLGSELGDIDIFDADDWSDGDIGGGQINLSELSWLTDLSFQGDSVTLATITFTGTGVGASDLSFSDVLLVDASDDANVISAEWITGQVQVSSPVPEPATMLLFGAGLVGLIGARLRKKK